MNDNAKKWVAALRSEEFRQTKEHLADTDGYCCLGVACELYRRETGDGKWVETPDGYEFLRESSVLPPKVRDWLGLTTTKGHYTRDESSCLLPEDNDDYDKSFVEIANIIESEPDGLFTNPPTTPTT